MIPFAIFDLMDSGISTFWKKGCRAVIEPDLIVPLFMIIYKINYIIMNTKINPFSLFVRLFFYWQNSYKY